jgi:hypothetical protein
MSCTIASTMATVASHVLTDCVLENPATSMATPVGLCTRPYTPSATATAAPIPSGTTAAAARVTGLMRASGRCIGGGIGNS